MWSDQPAKISKCSLDIDDRKCFHWFDNIEQTNQVSSSTERIRLQYI